MIEKRRPGRPVTHPKVVCAETGEVFDTYTEAASSVDGSRFGVMRCCNGVYKVHKGVHFEHLEDKEVVK